MNEITVMKRSVSIFLLGCLLFGIVGLIFRDISYIFGFVLGYIINIIDFYLIIKMSDGILKFKMPVVLVAMMFIVKLMMYGLGFYVAIKSSWIHIVGVFFGYLCMKISIHVEDHVHKGGEGNG